MREKLIQYVDLLFAGAEGIEEVKQEILQNTLDRYDDLVAQGKSPEAAYRLAMGGIGDVNELMGRAPLEAAPVTEKENVTKKMNRKLLTGLAIGLYILCPVPLVIIQNEIGLCFLLAIVAIATAILVLVGGDKAEEVRKAHLKELDQETELQRSVSRLVSAITLTVYLILSFTTGAWHITWVIFPISAAVKGLVKAILDLKEAEKHEG